MSSPAKASTAFVRVASAGGLMVYSQLFIASSPPPFAGTARTSHVDTGISGPASVPGEKFPSVSAAAQCFDEYSLRRSLLRQLAPTLPFPCFESFAATKREEGDERSRAIAVKQALECRPILTDTVAASEPTGSLPVFTEHLETGTTLSSIQALCFGASFTRGCVIV